MASSELVRIAVLGQKDGMVRALWELAGLGRSRPLEVIVLTPNLPTLVAPHGTSVQPLCEHFGFRHICGATDDEIYRELQCFQPTLIVSILWPRRIQNEVLSLCKDTINFHPSLLPKHRGSMTQFWAIFEGDAEAGTTCHRMVREFDAGRILHQVAVLMSTDETALSLNLKLATAIEQCFKHIIHLFFSPEGLPPGQEWDVHQFPYHFRKIPKGGLIDPTWPDDKVERFIRAMYFPPHQPAVAVDPDGEQHFVNSLEQYTALRAGHPVPPVPPPVKGAPRELPPACRAPSVASATAVSATASAASAAPRPHSRWLWPAVVAALALLLALLLRLPPDISVTFGDWRIEISNSKPDELQADPNLAVQFTLAGHPRARCLDGSPVSYYHAPGQGAGKRKWLVYLQGGGWCAEDPTLTDRAGYSHGEVVGHPELCSARAHTYHGTSKKDQGLRLLHRRGYISASASENPFMWNWNRVIVRNCDGTAFLGSADEPRVSNGTSLYFRGRDNLFATIDALLQRHGMDDAAEVMIGGCSAGGVAAVLLADQIKARIQRGVKGEVFVAGLADSAVFPHWAEPPPKGVLAFPQFQWIYEHANASGSAPPDCLAQGLSWQCLHVGVALPYVSTPMFIVQSALDSWQVNDVTMNSSLRVLASRLRNEVTSAIREPHGGAIDSCFHHCQEWGHIRWGGQTNAAALQQWYLARREEWLRLRHNKDRTSNAREGWPLVHAAESWIDECYFLQKPHRDWHMSLPRFGDNGTTPEVVVPPPR